jgi:hypothetical protein
VAEQAGLLRVSAAAAGASQPVARVAATAAATAATAARHSAPAALAQPGPATEPVPAAGVRGTTNPAVAVAGVDDSVASAWAQKQLRFEIEDFLEQKVWRRGGGGGSQFP